MLLVVSVDSVGASLVHSGGGECPKPDEAPIGMKHHLAVNHCMLHQSFWNNTSDTVTRNFR